MEAAAKAVAVRQAQVMDLGALLAEQGDGDFRQRLEEELARVVVAVRETGKKGEVKVKLTVAPSVAGDGGKVLVTDHVTATTPTKSRAPSLYYTTETGGLSRHNPAQLRFRDAAPEAGFPDER